jgi:hypothetical protein
MSKYYKHYGTTGWGYFQQGSDQWLETEELGAKLSDILGCPVHYPAFGKNLFECKCGVIFPKYVVKYCAESCQWQPILDKHSQGFTVVELS